jgi:hypothetical protein
MKVNSLEMFWFDLIIEVIKSIAGNLSIRTSRSLNKALISEGRTTDLPFKLW